MGTRVARSSCVRLRRSSLLCTAASLFPPVYGCVAPSCSPRLRRPSGVRSL
jgi:hypothetical protein